MIYDWNSNQVQRNYIKTMIDRNILACQTTLVNTLIENEFYEFSLGNVRNEFVPYSIALEYGMLDYGTTEDDYNDSPIIQDVYEWYLCSQWLADKLDTIGMPVLVTSHGAWWGGQLQDNQ